jgi:gliding motility-associated-like protein
MTINFIPPPVVNAGGTRYILAGKQITLTPTVSDTHVQYAWTPNVNINNTSIKNPVITGNTDITYTLTVTDSLGCTSQDQTIIKVSPEIKIPNTFTPNGDGVNDQWDIQGLIAYEHASVDIFNRWGQKVFHSIGYGNPWDGSYNAKPLPVSTYYYVIDTKMYGQVLSGSVTIIR